MIDYFLRQLIYPTHNPLYQLNTRHFCPERLRRDAQLIIGAGVSLAALWWLIEAVAVGSPESNLYITVLVALFFGSLAVMLAANVFYVLVAVSAVQQEAERGTWDLLRLSRLPPREITAAKYAVVQLRVWRVVALEVALRAAVVTLVVLPAVRTGVSLALTLTVTAIFLASLYLLEVWWRMRAVIGISLLLALIFPRPTSAAIMASLSMIGLHVLQAGYLAVCYGLLLLMLLGEFTLGFLCGMPFCALLAAGGTFFFYERVAEMALRRLSQTI
ncbi:MAG: hypothetical protein CUN51_06730 [Candidatus Thermofonsia Clade 1 bacterium]|uniref:Uncharacterized protein n=1 Tax=Candidatus Thermofonsia Clade 1 bacterium TaxID=2364210 RepID=A0A2M8NZH2_9CHLR|nr:MAG: hypothetical protein CUN51_06730 [Candidatus Thermofonsia Clade 1 bacterium]